MKNIVFDMGGVLLEWNPRKIAEQFTENIEEQKLVLNYIYSEEHWLKWDSGLLSEEDFAKNTSEITGIAKSRIQIFLNFVKESLVIIPETLDLINLALKNQKKVFCMSNMPPETYAYLKEKYSFFNLFNGIIISGIEKVSKPDPKLFEILLDRFSLKPGETLFIDDSLKNIKAAGNFGINTMQFMREPECYSKIKDLIMDQN